MVAKSTKAKSKRSPAVKTKAKRGSKPLLARSAEVRKSKAQPSQPVAIAPAVRLVAAPLAMPSVMGRDQPSQSVAIAPAVRFVAAPLAMPSVMVRVMQAYAQLPGRLAQCRSPFDVWREQVRFAQRIFT
jgi:hypothetical protein